MLEAQGRKPRKAKKKVETLALDQFIPGVTFEHAVQLYVFDKRLRLLVSFPDLTHLGLNLTGMGVPINCETHWLGIA